MISARGLVDVAHDIVAHVVEGIDLPARAKKFKVIITVEELQEMSE